ncbi:biliverdin-producing heme oxygenase [Dyadobacter luticola]|uniref:Biliverdin-producing heme oxygenase n=1 Tax=Dyadobacter luticola TaxID=1979387 RepID=A0A5R9KRC5_9BACT|nr:biliverdin-producing heme oxygenase [Dyadobacter luticola]TLU98783.1 biliverdin-producing heme oxygenase [Dyadobacter luticola]
MGEPTLFSKDQDYFVKSLRQETSESHQKLEENPLSKAILDPGVTLADYQAYLSKLYGVTIACEDQVFPAVSQHLPDLSGRYKSGQIIEDLSSTGMSDVEIDAIPVFQFHFEDTSEAMGIMYVLEGSTLGGRILYKHIHETLGLDSESGASYFWGYGAETGPRWKSFMAALGQQAESDGAAKKIIESAKRTFTHIDHWLSGSN